jgi:hypothetical protein
MTTKSFWFAGAFLATLALTSCGEARPAGPRQGAAPGNAPGQVLVPGNPPLTQDVVDLYRQGMEWALDLRLSEQDREKWQALFIQDWNTKSPAQRQKAIADWKSGFAWLGKLDQLTAGQRTEFRQTLQQHFLQALRSSPCPDDRFLLAVYESAHKPGGERNPVLVAGKPALTQGMVDRYGDHVEFVLGLSLTGLNQPKRQILRDYVVKDWKKMDRAAREEFLNTLKKWDELVRGPRAERVQWRMAAQPQLLARLRIARDDEFSQWLLGLYDNEQRTFQILSDIQRRKHETAMTIIRNMAPSGHYEYNPTTGRYDRYVPNR